MKNFNLPAPFCFLFWMAMFLIAAGSASAQTRTKNVLFTEPKTYGKSDVNQRAGKIDQISEVKNQSDEKDVPDVRKEGSPEGDKIIRQWYQILDRNSISNAAPPALSTSQKAPQRKLTTQTRRTKKLKIKN